MLFSYRDHGTPVVIGHDVSGPVPFPDKDIRMIRLVDLNTTNIDMH